jgi:hypothetical protein
MLALDNNKVDVYWLTGVGQHDLSNSLIPWPSRWPLQLVLRVSSAVDAMACAAWCCGMGILRVQAKLSY